MKQRVFTNADVDKIDQYLGANTYYTWDELDGDARQQMARKVKTERALWHTDHKLSVYSPYGTDIVEKLHEDLIEGFELILQSKFPDPADFKKLFALYAAAIDASALLIDAVEDLPVIYLVLGAVSVRYVGLSLSAAKLRDAILILDRMIGDALAEKIEAEIQAAFGMVSNTVGLVVPGLGLIAKGGMTIADLVIDDKLGPTKPNVISTVGDSSKALGYTLEVMQEIKRLGAATKTVAKRAGGVISVTGYYFDLSEVKLARANLKAIQDAMTKAQAENASLTKQLDTEIAKMQKAEQIMTSGIKPARRKAEAKAWERDQMIRSAGYSTIKAFPWKISVDLNRVTPWR